MEIKIIATDIDGTLMNDNSEIPNEIFEIIKELSNRDIQFIVASGRQINNLKRIFKDVSREIIFIAQNGAYIEYENKVLFCDNIKKEVIVEILQLSSKLKLNPMLYTKDMVIITDTSCQFQRKLEKYNVEYTIDKNYCLDNICKVSLMAMDGIDIHKCKKDIESINGISAYISSKDMIDITNNQTNKGTALRYVQCFLNISPNETVVFGDSENDIDMFNSAAHSYVMNNADNHIKKNAQHIAPSNNDNGVITTINLILKTRYNL